MSKPATQIALQLYTVRDMLSGAQTLDQPALLPFNEVIDREHRWLYLDTQETKK